MHYFTAHVVENRDLGGGFSWMRLGGCAPLGGSLPGQFVMLRGDWDRDPILPRAFSLLWHAEGEAEILIRRLGRGTNRLTSLARGNELMVLGPLGNGFPPPSPGVTDLLVAGGCGLAPLFMAARRAISRGESSQVELMVGAKRSEELALLGQLDGSMIRIRVATEDGSAGHKGLATDLLLQTLEQRIGRSAPGEAPREGEGLRVLSCGPKAMLLAVRAAARRYAIPCFLSLEAPMACGVGVCLGCAIEGTTRPYVYVCKDGPVFPAEEVWP